MASKVDTLHDADMKTRDLKVYDAIIIPDQGPQEILNGYRGWIYAS